MKNTEHYPYGYGDAMGDALEDANKPDSQTMLNKFFAAPGAKV